MLMTEHVSRATWCHCEVAIVFIAAEAMHHTEAVGKWQHDDGENEPGQHVSQARQTRESDCGI